jgi:hypothetical protein
VGRSFTLSVFIPSGRCDRRRGAPYRKAAEDAETKGQKTISAELFTELPLTVAGSSLPLDSNDYHYEHVRVMIRILHREWVSTVDRLADKGMMQRASEGSV